jgi:hypothetical protein
METVEIVYGILIIVQGFFLVWFGTLIKAQKSVIDSFKTQSGGVKDLQDMLLRQYKPETFENFAKAKEREFEIKYRDITETLYESNTVLAVELMDSVHKYRDSYYSFISMAAFFKLLDRVNYVTIIQILQFKQSELDEIETMHKKIIEGDKEMRNKIRKAGGRIVGEDE